MRIRGAAPFLLAGLIALALPRASLAAAGGVGGALEACRAGFRSVRLAFEPPSARLKLDDWRAIYLDARERENPPGAGYALLQMALIRRVAFGIFLDEAETFRAHLAEQERRAIARFKDPTGRRLPLIQVAPNRLREWTKDWLWSSAPFFWRGAGIRTDRRMVVARADALRERLRQSGPAELELPDDEFFARSLEAALGDPSRVATSVQDHRRGFWLRPARWHLYTMALGFLTLAFPGAPTDLLPAEVIGARLSPAYRQLDYFADLQARTGKRFEDLRIFYIADRRLLPGAMPIGAQTLGRLASGDVDPSLLIDNDGLRAGAGRFDSRMVGSIEELDRALWEARDADVVFIEGHGAPGGLYLNNSAFGENVVDQIPRITAPRLKPGAMVVYVSCSFGDRGLENPGPAVAREPVVREDASQRGVRDEGWIRLSRRILGPDGIAVASASTIQFRPFAVPRDAETRQVVGQLVRAHLVSAAADIASHGTLGPWTEILGELGYQQHVFGKGRVGLRVYDRRSGTVTYFERQE